MITNPVAAVAVAAATAATPNSNLMPSPTYCAEIERMMFAFGDSCRPLSESASVVEDIVHSQMEEVLFRASEVASRASDAPAKLITLEHVLFLLRKSPVKVQRLIHYLAVKDTASALQVMQSQNVSNEQRGTRVKRCKDFLLNLDYGGGILEQALAGQLHDEARMERLRRMDRMSRELTGKRYNDFTKARQVNFLGHKMKYPQKFHDWLTKDAGGWLEPGAKVDKAGLEVFTYLAYETVGQVVEMALISRKEMERDTVAATSTLAVNPRYPMYQLPQLHTAAMNAAAAAASKDGESPLRKRLKSGVGEDENASAAAASDVIRPPLRPEHIREAWRRLQHCHVGRRGLWLSSAGGARVDARHQFCEARPPVIPLGL